MAYLLDANVFISAKRLHYGLDFCPAFWDWLVRENEAGKVFSIEKVGKEIAAGGDDLSTWAAARGADFFLPPDGGTLQSFSTVTAWVQGQKYETSAVSSFLQEADYFLVSQAHAGSHTVVTHEKPAKSPKKIKIPDVCVGMKVPFITPFDMLRRENARFVLGEAP